MPSSRPPTRFRAAIGGIVLIFAATTLACEGEELVAERIPGTDRIYPTNSQSWFTISPDETWLAFMAIDSTLPPPPFNYARPPDFHMVTMNLATLAATHHDVSQIPEIRREGGVGVWLWIENGFRSDGWSDGRLYVRLDLLREAGFAPWVCFIPGVRLAIVEQPTSALRCVDCPPSGVTDRLVHRYARDHDNGQASFPYRNGRLSESAYLAEKRAARAIIRTDSTRSEDMIVRPRQFLRDVHIRRLRASPDEEYVAFVVGSRPKLPIPWPATYKVQLVNLRTGRVNHVSGEYSYVSGVLWSRDSNEFFYAAVTRTGNSVFRVMVPN